MKQRYVNKQRTREKFLDDPTVSIWGFTHEDLIKNGWILSDEPLRLTDKPCHICKGGRAFQTLGNGLTMHRKCVVCDSTGKRLCSTTALATD